MKTLENKVAIVTGGASGIGEAVAQAIAARGGQVIIADIDQNDSECAVATISESGEQQRQPPWNTPPETFA